jgi:predicted porin
MDATGHGLMHSSSNRKDMRNQVKFVVEDRGKGKIALKTADGRYVYIAGADYAFSKQVKTYGYAGYLTLEQADKKDKQPVAGLGLEFKF